MNTERVIQLLQVEKEYALKQTGFQQKPINKEVAEALDIAIEAVKFHYTGEACFKALQALAETDVVQVVKCKDCIYRYFDTDDELMKCSQSEYWFVLKDDDFCSDGERKDNENL